MFDARGLSRATPVFSTAMFCCYTIAAILNASLSMIAKDAAGLSLGIDAC
jgi:hypothetical protein